MAIRTLDSDLNFVSGLPDEPEEYSPEELKATFDESGNVIKEYINTELIPDVEAEIAGAVAAAEIESGNNPTGGTTGQVLTKNSGANYDYGWQDPSGVSAATANTVMKRDANGRAQVAEPLASQDVATKSYADGINTVQPWVLIQPYATAGSYTFTAPDLFNGKDYDIGVFIIGGGGSGAAVKVCDTTNSYSAATGGASGYAKTLIMTVTPGVGYTVVVGAGGVAAQTGTGTYDGVSGYTGGASAFNGVSALGGQGGQQQSAASQPYSGVKPGASGAQGTDVGTCTALAAQAPAGGMPTRSTVGNGTLTPGGDTTPNMCLNPFTLKRTMGAGGNAGGASGTALGAWAQTVPTLDDGLVAGAGASRTTPGNITAITATSPGSGGGAAAMSANTQNSSYRATSGAGAPGAVYIYARRTAS